MVRKKVVQFLFFFTLTLLISVFYFPFKHGINTQLEQYKQNFLVNYEDKFNIKIKYRSMSPTIINSIKIRDFSIEGTGDRNFSFNFEKISLFYRFNPFKENNPFQLRRILLKNGEITLVMPDNQHSKPINLDDILSETTQLLNSYFPSGSIDLRNIKVRLMMKNSSIIWEINQLSLNSGNNRINFNQKGQLSIGDEYNSEIQIRGSSLMDLSSFNAVMDLKSLISPYVTLNELSLSLSRSEKEGWLVRKVKDKIPLDLSIGFNNDIFNIIYQSERFIPATIMNIGPSIKEYEPWFNSEITGGFSLSLSMDGENINYNTDLKIKSDNKWIKPLAGGGISLDLNIEGDREKTDIQNLSLISPKGNISYRGSLGISQKKINGVFNIKNFILPTGSLFSSLIYLDSQENTLNIQTRNSGINNIPIGDLSGLGEILWDEKQILANLIYQGELAENFGIDIYADFSSTLSLLSWFDIESLDIDRILKIYNPELSITRLSSILKDSSVTSSGTIEYNRGININIDHCLFESPQYKLAFKGYGKGEQLFFSDISLINGENSLDGSLKIDLADDLNGLFRFSLNGFYYDLNLKWLKDRREIFLSGSHGIEGYLSYLHGNLSFFSLQSKELPFSWEEYEGRLNLSLSGSFRNNDLLINLGENLLYIDSSPFASSGELSFSGMMDKGLIQLSRLNWTDEYSTLNGTGMFNVPVDYSELFNGWITLISSKKEKYKLVFSQNDKGLSAFLSLENFILERLPLENTKGIANAELKGENLLNDPSLTGEFNVDLDSGGSLGGLLIFDKKRLTLSSINGNWKKTNLSNGLLSFDMIKGKLNISAGLNGILAKEAWKTGLVASFDMDQIDKLLESDLSGYIKLEEIYHGNSALSPGLTFHFLKKDRDYYLYNSDRDVLNLLYNGDSGSITALSQKFLPLSFYLQGYIKKDSISLDLTDMEMDLTKLNLFMPLDKISSKKIVEFDQGVFSGNLNVSGNPLEPIFNGQFNLAPLKLNTAYSVKEKGVTQAQIVIKDNQLNIPYFEMNIGTTGLFGAQAEVLFQGLKLEEYSFDFSLKGRNGGSVPIVYLIKGLALNGEAQGDVSLYGAGKQNFIDGDILIDKMVLSLVPGSSKKRERSLNPMDLQVDVTFTTGKDVSMVIPNEDFHFVKASLDINQELNLKLNNIPRTFSLNGDFSIRQGDIAYFDKSFYLTQGKVTFKEDQNEFNPLLSLNAETIVTYKGAEVTLMIDYNGTLFGDFDPNFSSIPSFTEREILAMLEPYQADDSASLALALGAYVDKYTFSAPFEEGLKKALNVDLVTIETGLLKNILEDQFNYGQGVYTNSSSQYNIARYLDGTFLNVGKYISKDLFVSGGLNLDYNANQTFMGGMGLDFNITFEMETPFFNLGWTYLPDDLDNLNSSEGFISDTGITINFRL
jgi:translocation and assembly module TamB